MDRLSVYIDAFNLYFGMSDRGWGRYLWLDLGALAKRLSKPGQTLVSAKYVTARVRQDKTRARSQTIYLQALEADRGVEVHYGRYQQKSRECRQCHARWLEFEEKMSDVRLATELLRDAFRNLFDSALIISGDGDLAPPMTATKEDFPSKRLIVVFPPRKNNLFLESVADESFRLGRGRLARCQLPYVVKKKDGFNLVRPDEWH
jgi:uncharacterized LabA/DUF88 family protein